MSKPSVEGEDPSRPKDYAPRFAERSGDEKEGGFYNDNGYYRWLKRELREGRIEPRDLSLLLLIRDEIDNSWGVLRRGWVKLKTEDFVEYLSTSRRKVLSQISRLEEAGYIQRIRPSKAPEPVDKRTSNRGWLYRVEAPWMDDPQKERLKAREYVRKALEGEGVQNGEEDESDDDEADRTLAAERQARYYAKNPEEKPPQYTFPQWFDPDEEES
jgi:hypothetical protein